MNYFSKIFVLSLFCMCTLNCSAYCMESGGNTAPDVANTNVNIQELLTPDEKKSENEKKSDSDAEVKQNDKTKSDNEDKAKNETKDKVESGEKTKPSEEDKSEKDSSNIVGKITVDIKERESNMDYCIIYDEDGNIVEIKDAKDSSDDSDDKCKERVKSYSYIQEITYYRS